MRGSTATSRTRARPVAAGFAAEPGRAGPSPAEPSPAAPRPDEPRKSYAPPIAFMVADSSSHLIAFTMKRP